MNVPYKNKTWPFVHAFAFSRSLFFGSLYDPDFDFIVSDIIYKDDQLKKKTQEEEEVFMITSLISDEILHRSPFEYKPHKLQ